MTKLENAGTRSNVPLPKAVSTRLRILLSVYACSPRRGSEEGVGWRWARELSERGHAVTVLTRTAYRDEIETERPLIDALGIQIVSFDLARRINYTNTPRTIGYPYIYIWQLHALWVARRLNATRQFDLIHHLTFGGLRFPSFLWCLGVPFVFGPIGGGETSPSHMRRGYPLRGKLIEWLRDRSNAMVCYDPLMRLTFSKAEPVVVRTRDNLKYLPKRAQEKAQVARECGIDIAHQNGMAEIIQPSEMPLRVLFVGRLLYWKGVHLALRAFEAARKGRAMRFTCVGTGRDRAFLHALASDLGLDDIEWIDWVELDEMPSVYRRHDVLLFPSLHDSGANVVYEAASFGLPVVCLDLGAPGEVVEPNFAFTIKSRDLGEDEVVDGLADALGALHDDAENRVARARAAIAWAERQSWAARVAEVYIPLERRLANARSG